MVVEYFPGKELLRRIFKKKNISEKTIKAPMKSLLKAILYMHEKGIMHRDIKPENIVLKEKRKLKTIALIDFGLATFVDQSQYIFYRCGTPGFIAPEIIRMKKDNL
jgi:serine/threonine protein kinase